VTRFETLSLELAGRVSQLAGHLWLRHPALFTARGRPDGVDPAGLWRDLASCATSPSQAATDRQSPVIAILPEYRDRSLAALLVELNLINEAWRQAKDRRYDPTRGRRYAAALRAVQEPDWLLRPGDRAEDFRARFTRAFLGAELARFGFPYTGSPDAGRPEVGALQSASPAGA
jgi:hypothetical protein